MTSTDQHRAQIAADNLEDLMRMTAAAVRIVRALNAAAEFEPLVKSSETDQFFEFLDRAGAFASQYVEGCAEKLANLAPLGEDWTYYLERVNDTLNPSESTS